MLQFPIHELLDEQKCHDYLQDLLHPTGFGCPCGCPLRPNQAPHKR